MSIHNSARRQIAEAFLNTIGGDSFQADEAMKEAGIDISGNRTKSVFDKHKEGKLFSYVITVCDETNAQASPIFPRLRTKTVHWSFDDPAAFVPVVRSTRSFALLSHSILIIFNFDLLLLAIFQNSFNEVV